MKYNKILLKKVTAITIAVMVLITIFGSIAYYYQNRVSDLEEQLSSERKLYKEEQQQEANSELELTFDQKIKSVFEEETQCSEETLNELNDYDSVRFSLTQNSNFSGSVESRNWLVLFYYPEINAGQKNQSYLCLFDVENYLKDRLGEKVNYSNGGYMHYGSKIFYTKHIESEEDVYTQLLSYDFKTQEEEIIDKTSTYMDINMYTETETGFQYGIGLMAFSCMVDCEWIDDLDYSRNGVWSYNGETEEISFVE